MRGMAICHNQMGELCRMQGDPQKAEGHYRDALAIYKNRAMSETVVVFINLALTLLAQQRFAEASQALVRAAPLVERQGRSQFVALIRLAQLTVEGAMGQWQRFTAFQRDVERSLSATGFIDIDIARLADQLGVISQTAGETAKASWAWRIAESQYQAIGLTADASRIGEALKTQAS